MEIDIPIQSALTSARTNTGVVPFLNTLATLDIEIISTGGTAVVLEKAGVRVTKVESLTGFPEMLDGRVKTLHPAIRSEEHTSELQSRRNLVCRLLLEKKK